MSDSQEILTRQAEPGVAEYYGDDPDQVIEWFPPEGEPTGTVVFLHGGFWRPDYDRAHIRPACHALRNAGVLVAALEYRRGISPADTVEDVEFGMAAIEDDPTGPLILLGHSAGGHLALLTEQGSQVPAGIVALAPITDPRDCYTRELDGDAALAFLGGTPEELPDVYDVLTPFDAKVPVIVLHGDADDRVPIEMSRDYASRHRAELRELPNTGHFELIDPDSTAWPKVLRAIDNLVRLAS